MIGFASSNAKCKWLKEELKIDHAFNYKLANPEICLKEAAPNGVDCFFDNVINQFKQPKHQINNLILM